MCSMWALKRITPMVVTIKECPIFFCTPCLKTNTGTVGMLTHEIPQADTNFNYRTKFFHWQCWHCELSDAGDMAHSKSACISSCVV